MLAIALLAPSLAWAQSTPEAQPAPLDTPPIAPAAVSAGQAPSAPTPAAPTPPAGQTALPPVTAREAPPSRPKPEVHLARRPSVGGHSQHPAAHPPVRAAALSLVVHRRASSAPAPAAPSLAPAYGVPNVGQGPVLPPRMASERNVSGAEINGRPVTRPGEVLEAAPGLIVTQHSGEGKANQYFLRGYNLDHGTDMAIWVDDMPINLRTHAHGQGYADLNWLMPELVNSVDVRKGPYFADEGDFGSAGNLHIGLIDTAPTTIKYTLGSFAYNRLFGMGSTKLGEGNLLFAGEAGLYNGPWANPDDMRKLNVLLRYSQGTALDGFSITGMAYSNNWNATNQVPLRAIANGEIGRYGSENPSDDGAAWRTSLSARIAGAESDSSWKASAFVARSMLDLYNDFTYYLTDPVNGDQFHQHDNRLLSGFGASRTFNYAIAGVPTETTIGLQGRDDAIDVGLADTVNRAFLSNVRTDKVQEASIGVYAENTVRWTNWLCTTVGWRGDYFWASDTSVFDPVNSGKISAGLGSPKFRLTLGPFRETELFFGAGMGMHSNDVRGATISESPVDRVADPTAASTPIGASPLLVRTMGAEVGLRTKFIQGLDSSVSLFYLHQASEIIFNGDGGDTSPSRPSVRYGIEWTNHYRPNSWIDIDADLAVSHARFTGYDAAQEVTYLSLAGYPQAQIGNAPGNYIQNAPAIVAAVGVTLGEQRGWSGALRWRYLGMSPLTEDNVFRSPPISTVNGRIGYGFSNGWRIDLDGLNLLNSKTNQITYAYGSIIKSDSLYAACFGGTPTAPATVCQNGVMDYVVHPIEPLAVRLTLTGVF